jgi:hypothetical protein
MFVQLLLTILSFLTPTTHAWGSIGHIAVAQIAQNNLTSIARELISDVIPNGDMSLVANWADEIRNRPDWYWSEPLHFIDIDDWICNYDRNRDCYNSLGYFNYCVDGAIQNYTGLLKQNNKDAEYLKFLIHFVGDIHQPLHCGFKNDRGGNMIKIHFDGHNTNLHSLWDSGLIMKRIKDDFENDTNMWIKYLINNSISDNCIGCSELWGNSSARLACNYSYVRDDGLTRIMSGDSLGDEYYKRNIVLIEQLIVYAGYRLGELLNYLYV